MEDNFKNSIRKAIDRVLKSNQFILGEELEELEREVAEYHGVEYAIGVNSGTDALFLILKALGLKGSIITSPYTFISTASSIVNAGCTPVFVDVGEDKLIDPEKVFEKSQEVDDLVAIMPVHLFGRQCDMENLRETAWMYEIPIIEDSCQAFGTPLTGIAAAISFYPTKSIGACGDAGMIITNDWELDAKLRVLRNNGSSLRSKYCHDEIGYNSRLDEIQAAVLREKLKHFKKGFKYNESKYYPLPLHLQPCFQYLGYKCGDMPMAEKFALEVKEKSYPDIPYVCP